MCDDLLEAEHVCVSGRVPVRSEDDVITETHCAPHGRIDAVLRHASARDKLLDARGRQVGSKSGLKECITGAFVDDVITGLG